MKLPFARPRAAATFRSFHARSSYGTIRPPSSRRLAGKSVGARYAPTCKRPLPTAGKLFADARAVIVVSASENATSRAAQASPLPKRIRTGLCETTLHRVTWVSVAGIETVCRLIARRCHGKAVLLGSHASLNAGRRFHTEDARPGARRPIFDSRIAALVSVRELTFSLTAEH